MTVEEAEAILGPSLTAHLRARPRPPLTAEQIDRLAPLLAPTLPEPEPLRPTA